MNRCLCFILTYVIVGWVAISEVGGSRSSQRLVVLAVVTTVLLWASAFVVIRAVGHVLSPGATAFVRLATGAAALSLIAARRRAVLPRGRTLALVLAYGLVWFAGYNVVLNEAERHLDAGTAALLVNVGPLLVAVAAGVLFREGFPRPLLAGLLVALAGVAIISVGGRHHGTSDRLGVGLGLAAAVLYAAGVLLQKLALRSVDAITATWLGCVAGTVVTAPFAGPAARDIASAPSSDLIGVVFLGLGPTALAFTTWAYALARTSAGPLAATTLVVPALVVLLSWLSLGEIPTPLALLGGAIALTGVATTRFSSWRQLRPFPSRPTSSRRPSTTSDRAPLREQHDALVHRQPGPGSSASPPPGARP